jgi:regulator of sigma E protease
MPTWLETVLNLTLVVLGFSAIIVIHELGHFLAAKWAGIRTLAFAVGFGPALVSFRKGLGWRRGSSEPELEALRARAAGDDPAQRDAARAALARAGSTEYRLNALPLGGYVKMLGQDDADPSARSPDPDSYQNCPPWKRMVVISAGVVANLITAALLFILVFKIGLLTEAPRIGDVDPGRPAAAAGLRPGDTVLSIDGRAPAGYADIVLSVMMAAPGRPLRFEVQRPGVAAPVALDVTPERLAGAGPLSIGATPYSTNTLESAEHLPAREAAEFARRLAPVKPGMTLVEVAGRPAASGHDLEAAVAASEGRPVRTLWRTPAGEPLVWDCPPAARLQTVRVSADKDRPIEAPHLLGLTPVMAVQAVLPGSAAEGAGLKAGDVFVSCGPSEWPSYGAAMKQIAAHAGRPLDLVVLRKDAGSWREVKLHVPKVPAEGKIGFQPAAAASAEPRVGDWPGPADAQPSGARLPMVRGSIIRTVNDAPVATYTDLRAQVARAAADAPGAPITLGVELPAGGTETLAWTLDPGEADALRALGWESPIPAALFEPEQYVRKAATVAEAIRMGLHEERNVVARTYLTFARLFQGTVQVQQLQGPVGIAHTGVIIADKGPVWLLFFMALVSVNLAVVNFLPIPIADGGHMVFLIYEQITGRPPSVRVLNAAAIAGLLCFGVLFVIVTFNDVGNLLTSLKSWLGR